MTLRAGEQLGPYTVLGQLGAGGMGEVFRASDPRLGRDVAIKVLTSSVSSDPARRRRFEQEARAVGRLDHPNVLAVHDVGEHEGAPFIVTELLEGETLRQRLNEGPLPVRKAVDCVLQVARGLAAAHSGGIVHRDLKPENVFLTKGGGAKILDFGLARQVPWPGFQTQSPTMTQETAPGVVLGTVGYMSPEQVRGEPADSRSDIFALGAVLYEMLAGRKAFVRTSAVETLNAILKEEPPELPAEAGVPPALDRLVRHCLEKKPEDRFQSAQDLAFELEGLAGASTSSGRATAMRAARPRWPALAAGACAALAALAGAWELGRRSAPSTQPTFRQITFGRGIASSGRFTPDGRTVVYSASWDGGAPEVYSVRTDAPESKSLGLPPGQVVAVSSRSELAVLLTEEPLFPGEPATLARVPLSGGTPRPVAERVECADWDPGGEGLAVLRDVGGEHRLEFPVGTVLLTAAEAGGLLGCPRFSPRGDLLAVGASSGYLAVELESGRRVLIEGVPEAGHATTWAWSPDGREIWFTASDALESRSLEAVSLSGRRRLLSRAPGALTVYDVSRDGVALLEHAFTRARVMALAPEESRERELSIFDRTYVTDISADGQQALLGEWGAATGDRTFAYLGRLDGSPPMRLAEDGYPSALSPDGRWALLTPTGLGPEESKWSGLRIVPVGAGEARTVATGVLQVVTADWVPGSDRLLVAGREPGRGLQVFLLAPSGERERTLTPEGVEVGQGIPCDGRRIACVAPGGRVSLYPLDGGPVRELGGLEAGTVPLVFSPNGRALLVRGPRATATAPHLVHRVDLATGERTFLRALAPVDAAGVWMPADPVLTPDARACAYGYYQFLHSLFLAEGVR